ncbi:MAG: hypothetical protein HZB23_10025 [Deltaproteobacteria bacterium]|nr:hypothetical protein [Deltaproteobacteria bacterium]
MKNFQAIRALSIYAGIALMLSGINLIVIQHSKLFAVAMLPVSFYAVALVAVRVAAPWVVRKKILDYLDAYGGEVSFEALMNRFAGADNPETTATNAAVLTPIIEDMENRGIVSIKNNMVTRNTPQK